MRGVSARVFTHGRRLALGAAPSAIHWLGEDCAFALGDGHVVIVQGEDTRRVAAHDGAILCAASHPTGAGLLTGGDDGRIALTRMDGETRTFAALGRKWIDHLAVSAASGLVIAAQGKDAIVFKPQSETPTHRFTHPSSIGGMALDAKGRRLAVSHYGGATLRYPLIAEDSGVALKWAGSHLAVTMPPAGDYVITGMQEAGLHGWRLPDKLDLRMSGYPAKTRSFSWDKRAKWLATSGAQCAVLWPFTGKQGPQGKPPIMVGERPVLVSCVAFHPSDEILAIGYGDGAVRVERLEDRAIVELDEPGEGAVTAIAWSPNGARIAFADEGGRGAIVAMD